MLRKKLFYTQFKFLSKLTRFNFCMNNKSHLDELNSLKKSLENEKESLFTRVKNIFSNNKIEDKINKEDINDFLEKDKLKINNLFGFIRSNINTLPHEINKFDKISEMINDIKFISKIKDHKKYSIFINDILFILTNCREPKEVNECLKLVLMLRIPDFNEFWENSAEKIKGMIFIMEFQHFMDFLIMFPEKNFHSN
jgi:hypothetical protein